MVRNEVKRRSGLQIMGRLIGLVKPLLPLMLAAIILGTAGYLCAISLTILAEQTILRGLTAAVPMAQSVLSDVPVKTILTLMLTFAVRRGILH